MAASALEAEAITTGNIKAAKMPFKSQIHGFLLKGIFMIFYQQASAPIPLIPLLGDFSEFPAARDKIRVDLFRTRTGKHPANTTVFAVTIMAAKHFPNILCPFLSCGILDPHETASFIGQEKGLPPAAIGPFPFPGPLDFPLFSHK